MKTTIKTTIKGNESIFVKESVSSIFEMLQSKNGFMLLTSVSHAGVESKIIIKKSSIKMVKS
jgi:hypothetical protein